MTTYAIILTTTVKTSTFRETLGPYRKQIHNLQQAGYEILYINLDDDEPLLQLNNLPEASVGLMWFRMHGSPQSMMATSKLEITVENCQELFKSLPFILKEDATIFLDSCLTGYLMNLNNMQFAFARLTLNKPRVQIAAPSESIHVSYFSILQGQFQFEMLELSYSKESCAVILGEKTKTLLSKAQHECLSLESIAKPLRESLETPKDCSFLLELRDTAIFSYDLTNSLHQLINYYESTDWVLERIKKLIEKYNASTNYPDGCIIPFSIDNATPLASAIFQKRSEIVKYLLANGADLFYTVNDKSLFDLADQRDETPTENLSLAKRDINLRREEEKDEAKIGDILREYLISSLAPKKICSQFGNHLFWSNSKPSPSHQGDIVEFALTKASQL